MLRSTTRVLIAFSILAILLFIASLLLGSVAIDFTKIWSPKERSTLDQIIFFESRLPRAITALLGGAALALAGLLMQTLFRNPLAGPSVLGISSGASLAVAVVTLGGFGSSLGNAGLIASAIGGAFMVLLIILSVARKFEDVTAVLIVGLMLSFFASALVSLLQSFASESAIKAFVFWGFGSFSSVSSHDIWFFSLPLIAVIMSAPFFIKSLDSLLLGELHAASMGISVKATRLKIMLATGILTGVVTAFCGPVAFIGLAAPHIARFVFKTVNHRVILPASVLLGGILALLCDGIARLPGSDLAIPLNTVCAFMGAPVVIYLIVTGRKRRFLL